jgi:hypothetical protein
MDLEDLDNNAGFVNLNARKLQKAIHDYRKYLDYLLKHRIIRTDMRYVVGKKSFGYLVIEGKEHKASVVKIPVTSWPMIKRLRNEANNTSCENRATENAYSHLTKWFNPLLKINVQAAKEKVEELFPEKTSGIRGRAIGKPSLWARRYKAVYSIEKFERQEFYYNVDDNVGRFHSNLANIKRELRNFITYDGQKLVNVDIKNSQPLFSTLLLSRDFWRQGTSFMNIFDIPSAISLLSNSCRSSLIIIIMIVKSLDRSDIQLINNYTYSVASGEFYKHMSDILHPGAPFVKQRMKEMIFTVFFSSHRFIGQPGAKDKRLFAQFFPDIYRLFSLIKKNNHTTLSHILQRIESQIIVQNAPGRIAKENPNLPIFTIHDSIATTVGNEEYVKNIIVEEVFKLTGLNANVGFEYWE